MEHASIVPRTDETVQKAKVYNNIAFGLGLAGAVLGACLWGYFIILNIIGALTPELI